MVNYIKVNCYPWKGGGFMCTQGQLKDILNETSSSLNTIFGAKLQSVLLYGSFARGDQDDESDIDVMALVDMPKDELAKYRRTVSDLSSEIDLRHDVLLSIKLQDADTFHRYANTLPFFQNIVKEGVSIVR